MNDLQYEFQSYEEFPDDNYIAAIVDVCFHGTLVIPCLKLKSKTGAQYWSFPSSNPMQGGVRQKKASFFLNKISKQAFENAIESFIARKKNGDDPKVQQQNKDQQNANYNGSSKVQDKEPEWMDSTYNF